MSTKPIYNEIDYDMDLNRIDELMDLNPILNTPQSDELEVLVLLIKKYEEKEWAISEVDSIKSVNE